VEAALRPAVSDGPITVYQGDALEVLRELPSASVDSVVTDPPAGIAFMGKAWDTHTRRDFVAFLTAVLTEARRVLRPGGHALVWAIPRTSHWTAWAVEDAGFEVRDVLTHLFGSGFPKSRDVSKAIDEAQGAEREVLREFHVAKGASSSWANHASSGSMHTPGDHVVKVTAPASEEARRWEGWGTGLKPASEHWILARSPLAERNVAAQVLASGTGALNIDACRVEAADGVPQFSGRGEPSSGVYGDGLNGRAYLGWRDYETGRWPANLILSHAAGCDGVCVEGCPVAELDRQSGSSQAGWPRAERGHGGIWSPSSDGLPAGPQYGDLGGASRFFYTAKASPSERNEGLDDLPLVGVHRFNEGVGTPGPSVERNLHPTVKPVALMRWLVKLITPPGGTVLDPFAGSGTTLVAARKDSFRAIGVEREPEYVELIRRRIVPAALPLLELPAPALEVLAEAQAEDALGQLELPGLD
jgi:hypothetical protein